MNRFGRTVVFIVVLIGGLTIAAGTAAQVWNTEPASPPVPVDRGADGPSSGPGDFSADDPAGRSKLWIYVGIALCITTILAILAYMVLDVIGKSVTQPADVRVVAFGEPLDARWHDPDYIREKTQGLEALGFSIVMDFKVPELPHEGVFRWMVTSTGDHSVLLAQIQPDSGRAPAQVIDYLEFQTELDNGVKVNSNNSPLKQSLLPPPHLQIFAHARATSPHELYTLHRQNVDHVRTVFGGRVVPQRRERFEAEFCSDWRETLRFQSSKGLLRLGEDGMTYHGTAKLVVRYLFTPNPR